MDILCNMMLRLTPIEFPSVPHRQGFWPISVFWCCLFKVATGQPYCLLDTPDLEHHSYYNDDPYVRSTVSKVGSSVSSIKDHVSYGVQYLYNPCEQGLFYSYYMPLTDQ